MNWQRITALFLFDLRCSLQSIKGLFFLIPFFLFWCLFLYSLKDGAASWFRSNEGMLLATWLFDFDMAKSLFLNHPPTLSLFLVVAVSTMPLFVLLGSNDQLASDSARGPLRFLLTRCTRSEIFLSRFVSALVLITAAFLLMTLMATMISFSVDSNTLPEIIHYGLESGLILVIYAAPFAAFMSIISAFTSTALGSLLSGFSVYCLLLGVIAWYRSDVPDIVFLLPSVLKNYLYVTNPRIFMLAVCGLVLYTCAYLSIGWWLFRRRNL